MAYRANPRGCREHVRQCISSSARLLRQAAARACGDNVRSPRTPENNAMTTAQDSIGTPGTPWGDAERALWRSRQSRRRSYADDVLGAIDGLRGRFDVVEYGDRKSTRLNSSH